jgi:hypothetical protein
MELQNRIAALTKQSLEMVGREAVPQALLGWLQIIVEESYKEFVSRQQMGQP